MQGVDPIHQLAADLAAFRTRFDHFEARRDLQMEFIVAGLGELGVQAPFNEVDTDNAATEGKQSRTMGMMRGLAIVPMMMTVEMIRIAWWNDCA